MNEELCSEKMKNHEQKLQDHERRIDDLEKTYSIMQKMDFRVSNIETSVSKIDSKLEKRQEEKGNKWDKFIDYIFYFVIATILGYLVISLKLK